MGRRSRAETLTFRNGKLVHPRPEVLFAEVETNGRMKEAMGEALAALDKRGAPPASGAATNGTANGHAAPPLSPIVNGHAGGAPKPAEPTATTTAPDDRDAGGRFAVGNKGGPGNPFARQVAARRQALLDAVSAEDIALVARKLRDQALGSDTAAAKVLLAYLIGKPAEAADPDRLDLHELALMMESPDMNKMLAGLMNGLPPQLAMVLGWAAMEMSRRRVLDRLDRQAATAGETGPGKKAAK